MLDRSFIVGRISQFMPMQDKVTFYSRTGSTDNYKNYKVKARIMEGGAMKQLPISPEILAVTDQGFEIYLDSLTAAGAPNPQKDDYIIDANKQGWTILEIVDDINNTVFRCLCVKRAP